MSTRLESCILVLVRGKANFWSALFLTVNNIIVLYKQAAQDSIAQVQVSINRPRTSLQHRVSRGVIHVAAQKRNNLVLRNLEIEVWEGGSAWERVGTTNCLLKSRNLAIVAVDNELGEVYERGTRI